MSATTEELRIDLDAADAKKGKTDDVVVKTDDEPIVKVEEAPKPAAAAAKPGAAAAKTDDEEIIKPEEGIAKLQKQLESERTLRQDAERRAEESSQAEIRARTDSQDNQLQLVTTAITQIKQANDLLKSKYREARAAGDADTEFDIQTEISTNAAKLIQLEAGKSQLEKAPKPIARPPTDMVEEFAARCSPRAAAWIRLHPDFVRDKQKNRRMIAAHELALADNNIADSDEYFASIEQTLRLSSAPAVQDLINDDSLSDAAAPTVRKPAPAAAPVSRGGNGTGSRPNVVTLSPEEVEMAELNGLTPEQYARNKIALKKLGRLN